MNSRRKLWRYSNSWIPNCSHHIRYARFVTNASQCDCKCRNKNYWRMWNDDIFSSRTSLPLHPILIHSITMVGDQQFGIDVHRCWPQSKFICRLSVVLNLRVTRFTRRSSISSFPPLHCVSSDAIHSTAINISTEILLSVQHTHTVCVHFIVKFNRPDLFALWIFAKMENLCVDIIRVYSFRFALCMERRILHKWNTHICVMCTSVCGRINYAQLFHSHMQLQKKTMTRTDKT